MKEIVRLKKLTHLSVCDTSVTDQGLKELVSLENLRQLFLLGFSVTDKSFKVIAALKNLTLLNLYQVPSVTDAGLKESARLRSSQNFTFITLE